MVDELYREWVSIHSLVPTKEDIVDETTRLTATFAVTSGNFSIQVLSRAYVTVSWARNDRISALCCEVVIGRICAITSDKELQLAFNGCRLAGALNQALHGVY